METFLELVGKRHSIRKFLDKPVERDKIDLCVEAARLAPSAENVQPWRFVIIDDKEQLARLSRAAFSGIYKVTGFASKAAAIAILVARPDFLVNQVGARIQGTQFYLLDMGIAGEHFVLQAAELGIGTCWIGWFNKRKVQNLLKIPRTHKISALIAMGYFEQEHVKPKSRKNLDEIRFYNQYRR